MKRARYNSNGNSRDDLIDKCRTIKKAALELETAMRDAYPHGRNYLTVDPPAFDRDMADVDAMLTQVRCLYDFYNEAHLNFMREGS